MAPSRWLFLTTISAAVGITLTAAVAPFSAKVFITLCLLGILLALRVGGRGFVFTVLVVALFVGRTQHATPMAIPQPAWLINSREVFVRGLTQAMPDQEAQLGAGMLIGATDGINNQTIKNFRTTGLSHVLAVSGSNLSIILAALTTLGVALSRRSYALLTILFAPVFTLFTGGEPSILRAAVMAIFAVGVRLCFRHVAGLNVLAAAVLFMLAVDPTLLWGSIGFQLSVAATFGLIAFSGPLENALKRIHLPGSSLLAATLGATFATLPIILLTFQQLCIIGPIANLVVVPLVPFIMAFVTVAGIVSLVFPMGAAVAGLAGWATLRFVEIVTTQVSKIPYASITLSPIISGGIGVLLLLALIFFFNDHVRPLFD